MTKFGWFLVAAAAAVFVGWCCAIGKVVWTVASAAY